jgi:hypothetical protein
VDDGVNIGRCARIRHYHPKLYDRRDRGAPVIEKVEIVTDAEG